MKIFDAQMLGALLGELVGAAHGPSQAEAVRRAAFDRYQGYLRSLRKNGGDGDGGGATHEGVMP